jgi:hypothetical protein
MNAYLSIKPLEGLKARGAGGPLRSTVGDMNPKFSSSGGGAEAPTRGDARICRVMVSLDLFKEEGRAGGGGRAGDVGRAAAAVVGDAGCVAS